MRDLTPFLGAKMKVLLKEIKKRAENLEQYTSENLSEIVKIKSLSGEEEQVINKIKAMLEKVGFDEVYVDGLGNLIGRIGNGKKILAFDAHIDTVDTGDLSQWDDNPFSGKIENQYIYGRGTVDQKGGAASMITAGKILKELKYSGKFSLYFTFTIMEEDCDGLCWNYLIEKENLKPDFAVITEPTNLNIYIGHRGRMEFDVFFKGLSAHGSAPDRGKNAIYLASSSALKLKDLNHKLKFDPFLGKGSLSVTEIKSQSPSLCAVPDKCCFHIDRRLTKGETKISAKDEIQKILGDNSKINIPVYKKKSYKGKIFYQEKYFPTWITDKNNSIVKAGISSYQNLFDSNPVVDKWTFSTNGVAIAGKHNIPTLGFGPGNEVLAHAPNEKISIDHLNKATSFYCAIPYFLEKSG